jgi:hypothetical protein
MRARALADASRDMRLDFIVGIVCDSSRATPLATAMAHVQAANCSERVRVPVARNRGAEELR